MDPRKPDYILLDGKGLRKYFLERSPRVKFIVRSPKGEDPCFSFGIELIQNGIPVILDETVSDCSQSLKAQLRRAGKEKRTHVICWDEKDNVWLRDMEEGKQIDLPTPTSEDRKAWAEDTCRAFKEFTGLHKLVVVMTGDLINAIGGADLYTTERNLYRGSTG